eukprot:656594-Rhodomonas_salina.1
MRLAVLTVSPKMDHRGTCAPPTQPLSVSQTRAAMSGQLDLVADDAAAQRARVEPDLDERGLACLAPHLEARDHALVRVRGAVREAPGDHHVEVVEGLDLGHRRVLRLVPVRVLVLNHLVQRPEHLVQPPDHLLEVEPEQHVLVPVQVDEHHRHLGVALGDRARRRVAQLLHDRLRHQRQQQRLQPRFALRCRHQHQLPLVLVVHQRAGCEREREEEERCREQVVERVQHHHPPRRLLRLALLLLRVVRHQRVERGGAQHVEHCPPRPRRVDPCAEVAAQHRGREAPQHRRPE